MWAAVSRWGLEKIGDYGAFFYLMAISGGGPYAGQGYETPDDGTAVLTALTKCDRCVHSRRCAASWTSWTGVDL